MKKPGLTLIELLIAASLAIVLMGTLLLATSGSVKFVRRLTERGREAQTARFVLSRIAKDIRENNLVAYSLVDGRVRRESGSRADYLTDYHEVKVLSVRELSPGLKEVTLDGYTLKVAKR